MLTQNLWNNAFILPGNNPLLNRSLVSKGIKNILDLIVCDGNFTCWNSMVSKFNLNINEFFAWFGVIQCIPSYWKCIIRSYLPLQTVQYDKVKYFHRGIFVNNSFLEVVKVTSKMIYNIHIDKLFKTPTSKLYYSSKFNVTEDDWPLIYTLAGKLTLDSKLRVFHYKVLNNILYLNKSLYKMKLVDTPLYTFCQWEEETSNHLFLECEYSKTLWSDIQNWLEGDLPNINSQDVVLEFVERQFFGRIDNFLLLLYKRFIYISTGFLTSLLGLKDLKCISKA